MRLVLVLGLALLAAGCLTRERDAFEAAWAEYRTCVEERGAEHPDCLVAREGVRTASERYERHARRAWGCNPADPECPRDGSQARRR